MVVKKSFATRNPGIFEALKLESKSGIKLVKVCKTFLQSVWSPRQQPPCSGCGGCKYSISCIIRKLVPGSGFGERVYKYVWLYSLFWSSNLPFHSQAV